MRRLTGLLLWVLQFNTQAAPPAPQDFAYGLRLQVPAGGALYRLPVPEAVYLNATRSDLGDLRLFNAQGEILAHLVRAPAPPAAEERFTSVPYFPLPEDTPTGDGPRDLRIEVTADGAIVNVRRGQGATGTGATRYLVDTSQLQWAVAGVQLEWSAPAQERFFTAVQIESGSDLEHWQAAGNAQLAQLRYGEHALRQDEIALSAPVRGKYLKLTWPAGRDGVAITAVRVMPPAPVRAPQRWTHRFDGAAAQAGLAIDFDLGTALAVDRVRPVFQRDNLVTELRIVTRADTGQPWTRRCSGVVYALNADGRNLASTPLSCPGPAHRYWRIELQGENASGLTQTLPQLEVSWPASEIVFVASGTPPYTLAYASARVPAPPAPVRALLTALDDESNRQLIREATVGEPIALSGDVALRPKLAWPWQQILLWAVLIGAVALLSTLALRLYRDMKKDRN